MQPTRPAAPAAASGSPRARPLSLLSRLALLSAVAIASPVDAAPRAKVAMRVLHRVVLDPGHGGENTGCMGFHGIFEKFLTLQIAERVEAALRERTDAEVFLTRRRDEDFGLRERANYAREVKGDVFVSIHLNASLGGQAQGVETYFLSATASSDEIATLVAREEDAVATAEVGATADDVHRAALDAILFDARLGAAHQLSERLADLLQHKLLSAIPGTSDRGVKQAPFAVLKEATVPAVVVECGFLTNEQEGTALLLDAHQQRVADAVADAIVALDGALAPPDAAPPRSAGR